MVMKEAQETQRRLCMSCTLIALWRKCKGLMARYVGVWAVNALRASGIERSNGVMHQWQARPQSVISSIVHYVYELHMFLMQLERSIATVVIHPTVTLAFAVRQKTSGLGVSARRSGPTTVQIPELHASTALDSQGILPLLYIFTMNIPMLRQHDQHSQEQDSSAPGPTL